jgi:hypothetical protein
MLFRGKLSQHENKMAKFNYEIEIEAPSEKEADNKMKSATTLLTKLNGNELSKLAHIVKNDPVKLALAKNALGV